MKYIQFILLFIFIMSCSSLKKNKEIEISTIEETNSYTTKFYKIITFCNPHKEKFKLNERKSFDIKITNYGLKNLYLPEWLDTAYENKSELYIEIYKIIDDKFEKYKSNSFKNIHTNPEKRKIFSCKNGESIYYNDIELDKFIKIKDKGKYYAKIYIDLSDFGYFKKVEGDTFFEVIDD